MLTRTMALLVLVVILSGPLLLTAVVVGLVAPVLLPVVGIGALTTCRRVFRPTARS